MRNDEKVGGLPELPRKMPVVFAYEMPTITVYAYTADQMHQYARDALSAHGLPVVDEAAINLVLDAQPFAGNNDARRESKQDCADELASILGDNDA